jgi:hypothetical protein
VVSPDGVQAAAANRVGAGLRGSWSAPGRGEAGLASGPPGRAGPRGSAGDTRGEGWRHGSAWI